MGRTMRTTPLLLISVLFLVLGFSPPDVRSATVTLPVTTDTFIISSAPDNNAGGNVLLNVGRDGAGGVRRGLLRFDLGSIPAGATVTSAVLRLTVVRVPFGGPVNSNFKLYRLQAEWAGGAQAGNSGSPAVEGEVTWNSRLHLAGIWTVPGAGSDTENAPSASRFVTTAPGVTYDWSGAGLVRDVQDWLIEPDSNFGWLLRSDDEVSPRTARAFAALENGHSFATLEIGFIPRVNMPPTVAITSPTNGAILLTGAVAIAAASADPDGTVASVRFLNGTNLLGTDTLAPFGIIALLTNGSHTLRAVALDNEGASTTSAPVVINVILSPPPVLQIIRSGPSIIIAWEGPHMLESTPVLNHPGSNTWTPVAGASPVTLPVNSTGNRFFRAVFR